MPPGARHLARGTNHPTAALVAHATASASIAAAAAAAGVQWGTYYAAIAVGAVLSVAAIGATAARGPTRQAAGGDAAESITPVGSGPSSAVHSSTVACAD